MSQLVRSIVEIMESLLEVSGRRSFDCLEIRFLMLLSFNMAYSPCQRNFQTGNPDFCGGYHAFMAR